MKVGIMDKPRASTVDVRDMLCVQALAVVAQAAARLGVGEPLEILSNADDVRHDLLVWARARAFAVHESAPGVLRLIGP
jgi:TusA-related sulfurtransferase